MSLKHQFQLNVGAKISAKLKVGQGGDETIRLEAKRK